MNGTFSPNTPETIVNRLNIWFAGLGIEYTVGSVTTKLKNYKRCWQVLHEMRTNTTGMGWDDRLEKPTMSEDRFNEYCQRSAQTKGFLMNGCPNFDLCANLWENNVAVGQEAAFSGALMSTDEANPGGESPSVGFNPFAFMGNSGPGEGSGEFGDKEKGKGPTAAEDREARIRSCANFDAWSVDPTGEQKRRDEIKKCVDEIKAMPIPYALKMKGFKEVMKTKVCSLWIAFDDEDKLQFLLSLD